MKMKKGSALLTGSLVVSGVSAFQVQPVGRLAPSCCLASREEDYYNEPNQSSDLEREIEIGDLKRQGDDDAYLAPRPRRSQPPIRRDEFLFDDEDEGFYDDDYEEEEEFYDNEREDEIQGNFWSNPTSTMDDEVDRRRTASGERSRRRRKTKASVRSPATGPPPPVRDLYNRMFWYGFDPAESETNADPTMFGGTKGKFNGLSYLNDDVGIPRERRRRRPRNYEEDFEFDDKVAPDQNDYFEANGESSTRVASVTPPFDAPQPRRSSSRRKSRRERDNYEEDFDFVDAVTKDWFTDASDDRKRPRRRRSETTAWSPFKAIDTFLGMDRESLDSKAKAYDQQMGLGGDSSRDNGRPRQRRRRKGFAYKLDPDEDDRSDPLEADPVAEWDELDPVIDVDIDRQVASNDAPDVKPPIDEEQRQLTWEERALAMERVPPVGISAWGPTGEVGMDARAKAISDALEDLQTAKAKVQDLETRAEQAREDLSVARLNAQLERKRFDQSRSASRRMQEIVRQVEKEADKASRSLRYAESRLTRARQDLDSLEKRHWAVLSCYDPTKVESNMLDVIREFEEIEPAAKRAAEKVQEDDNADLDANAA